MRKVGLILAVLLCLSWLSSNSFAVTFTEVGVVSTVEEYSGEFTTNARKAYMLIYTKPYSSIAPTTTVTTTTPPPPWGSPSTADLNASPGWGIWYRGFGVGTDLGNWYGDYSFDSGADNATLTVLGWGCTFRELDAPQVTINGNTVSWDEVEYATNYQLRWLDIENGDPVTLDGFLAESGMLDNTQRSYTITGLASGIYALRVEALEFCDDSASGASTGQASILVNRSNYYLIHTIESSIPTLSEWGFIILGLLFSVSFIWIKRRNTQSHGEMSV